MKNVILEAALIVALLTGLCYAMMIFSYNEGKKSVQPENAIPTFVWNDDIESVPVDGTKVVIEFTKNDTIYIGPAE